MRGSGRASRHSRCDRAVSAGGSQRGSETRTFGTDTGELIAVDDRLIAHEVIRVGGLESTGGVYWKPVVRHEALEIEWGGERPALLVSRSWPVKLGAV